jgi:hypothetical protein
MPSVAVPSIIGSDVIEGVRGHCWWPWHVRVQLTISD